MKGIKMRSRKNRFTLSLAVMVMVALLFSCSKKQIGNIQITKENGVTIVSNPAQPLYPNAKLVYEEELSIGEEEGDSNYVFYRPANIVVDSEEHIYLLDSGNNRVQVFDAAGKFLYSFGKKGQGPGEFMMAYSMVLSGDEKLYILDLQNRRMSVFQKNGKYLQGFDIKEGSPQFLFIDENENLFMGKILRGKTPNDQKISIGKYDINGNLLLTFKEFAMNSIKFIRSGKSVTAIPIMFNPSAAWTVDNRGNVYSGLGDQYVVDVQSADSMVVKQIKRNWQPIPVTSEDKNKYNERFKSQLSSMIKEIEFRNTKPAFSRFTIDDQNNLWVKLYTEFGFEENRCDVFDPEGKYLYQVEISIRPDLFKNGKIYTIERTEEGIAMVKRYGYHWEK
ncbi:MAG TPA: 6-bladed beta-propeller [Bacteroidetes bacterium]|nr:6-bladed beta-propeller [Bacteroidota bacterium]